MKLYSLLWVNRNQLGQILLSSLIISLGFSLSALASTKQLTLTISSQESQNFRNLMQAAEALATNTIQQSFQSSSDLTEMTVNVMGENYGQRVPLLSVTVSPSNWQKDPQIKSWVKYFGNTEILLGFVRTSPPTSPSTNSPVTRQTPYLSENEPNFYQ